MSVDYRIMAVVANVLLDQIGLPVPAVPTLIVAGALAAEGHLSATALLFGCVLACLLADTAWFVAGRIYGNRVMKLLCRISLTPDSCVSQTQERFERWGPNALLVAKFIPGLAIIAAPLAGATRMRWRWFLTFSTAGSAAWVGAALAAGMLFQRQIEQLLPRLAGLGIAAVLTICALLAVYIAYKWRERMRFYAALRMARISVEQLYELIGSGAAPLIVDVRSPTALLLDPRRIPGALHVSLHDVERHVRDLARDREIVAYCTCPNEASAAQVVRLLMNSGFKRVRPLLGGLDAWVAAGYAVDSPPGSGPMPQQAAGRRPDEPSFQ
ncbi:MAG: DedA family protein/thiosulfate sulfurtransferase GlpE [Steroidobacteraceae bacterium]